MTPERFQRITKVLQTRQSDLTVITDEVHKSRNLAAIVRTCDAVGIDKMHCVIPTDGFQTYSNTSAGSEKWVEVESHHSVETPIAQLKAQNYQIVAANLSDTAIDYREIDYTKPTALLMGAEVRGVSEEARAYVDQEVILPMYGMVESYNVSVACALILAQAQNQREDAGMYASTRLSAERYRALFFKWAHPVLAEYCDTNHLDYPPVREDGEVVNLSQWYAKVNQTAAHEA
ncbi:MAG: tRNA (guanosine(18)-2'-O)-methyltransferase TrmH [Agarilytica sp.]